MPDSFPLGTNEVHNYYNSPPSLSISLCSFYLMLTHGCPATLTNSVCQKLSLIFFLPSHSIFFPLLALDTGPSVASLLYFSCIRILLCIGFVNYLGVYKATPNSCVGLLRCTSCLLLLLLHCFSSQLCGITDVL